MSPTESRRLNHVRTAGLLGVPILFLLVDIVAMPYAESGYWSYVLCSGVVLGQTNLIAVWAGLVQVNVVIRLSVASLLCALLWTSVVLSRHPGVLAPAQLVVGSAMDIVGVAVLLQIPLAIVAVFRGWRLTVWIDGSGRAARGASQFRLLHIFWAILLLSAALGLVRLWFSQWMAIGFTYADIREAAVSQLVRLAIVTVWDALLLLPLIRIAFVSARWLVPAIMGALAHFVGISVLITLVSTYDNYARISVALILWELLTQLPTYGLYVATIGATTLITLGVCRALGCRLERGQPQRAADVTGESVPSQPEASAREA